jgi:hypothetical protein
MISFSLFFLFAVMLSLLVLSLLIRFMGHMR